MKEKVEQPKGSKKKKAKIIQIKVKIPILKGILKS
jgi:hypothetical protein